VRESGCGVPHPKLPNVYCHKFNKADEPAHGPFHTGSYSATNSAGGVTGEYVSWPVKTEGVKMIRDTDKGEQVQVFVTGGWEFSGFVESIDHDLDLVYLDDMAQASMEIDMDHIVCVKRSKK